MTIELLLGIIIFLIIGFGASMLVYLIKTDKLDIEKTTNVIYTTDQVMDIVYDIVIALSDEEKVVTAIYNVLDELLAYAQVLVEEGVVDKQHLVETAFKECENVGLELDDKAKAVLRSAVSLIYMFVRQ